MAKKKNYQIIKIDQLELNNGQLEGLAKNPRFIKDERFAALKKSIEDAPELLDARTLLVYPLGNGKYITIAGNMRLRACRELGYKDIPCYVFPKETTVEKLREYTIKDNIAFGSTDWDALANEWEVADLKDWGMECDFLDSGEDVNLDDFFEEVEGGDAKIAKDIEIKIVIPEEDADIKDDVLSKVKEALSDYPNITFK